ncbi:MAG: hypothetical protein AAGD01_09585 [Acidobacteriota bacterium]
MSASGSNVNNFIDDLVNDPDKWAQLRTQPQEVLSNSGLSQSEQDMLTKGSVNELSGDTGRDPNKLASMIIIW